MSIATASQEALAYKIQGEPNINDMVITVATANGSGSQTSNNVLMRSIFRMGVPCNGKNMFPSNIQGLPTWFTIRVSKDGWIGRRRDADILVCMNPDSVVNDIARVRKGAVVIHEESLKIDPTRDDLICYSVPFKKMVAEVCPNAKLRKLVVNMIYVGVCCELFGIDLEIAKDALSKELKGKAKAIELNKPALEAGAVWARENLTKSDNLRVEAMPGHTDGKIIINGNEASALGALYGGCTVLTWYPITPSSSLCEALIDFMEEFRVEGDGKKTFTHIQGEDEIASVGIAIGAAWAGARAMTATSGPGISLMAEFIGLAYFAEIPVVIGDVARGAPSTGMPTRTMQSDLISCYFNSHGDTKHPVIIPGSVKECFELYCESFNIAEQLQCPVFVLTDLDLGMNNWPSDPFDMPTAPINRGKVLDEEAFKKIEKWGRYKDVDGDAIGYRTLPGSFQGGAYFTRGTSHDEYSNYSEDDRVWVANLDRLARKLETARAMMPKAIVDGAGAKKGVIAFGTSDFSIKEVLKRLRAEGKEVDYLRMRALPVGKDVLDFIRAHDEVMIVEQNHDAQMRMILRDELPEFAAKMQSLRQYDGLPLAVETVYEGLVDWL